MRRREETSVATIRLKAGRKWPPGTPMEVQIAFERAENADRAFDAYSRLETDEIEKMPPGAERESREQALRRDWMKKYDRGPLDDRQNGNLMPNSPQFDVAAYLADRTERIDRTILVLARALERRRKALRPGPPPGSKPKARRKPSDGNVIDLASRRKAKR